MTSSTSDAIVVHYHEVGLKGRNRSWFEHHLAENIRGSLLELGLRSIKSLSGRIVVLIAEDADLDAILDRLSRVFGIAYFSPTIRTNAAIDHIIECALDLAKATQFETFEVRARRSNTSLDLSSQKINELVGEEIRTVLSRRVDLDNPDWSCHIEIVGNVAYLSGARYEGPGGLPVGVSGKVLALLSGGIDSPVAAWEIGKRGADVDFIHFHGQPYSDPSSARQASMLARHLTNWLGETRIWMVPFGETQSEIVKNCPEELRILLYRRFMLRIAESLALREGAEALITGDSVGQVASQTLSNLRVVDAAATEIPVLRPLSGRDKAEIEVLARRIGTYQISTQPHQDCCVLFTPRRVLTHAKKERLEQAEAVLEVSTMVEKCLADVSLVTITRP